MLVETKYTFKKEDLIQLARTRAFQLHPDGKCTCPPKNIVEKDNGDVEITLVVDSI